MPTASTSYNNIGAFYQGSHITPLPQGGRFLVYATAKYRHYGSPTDVVCVGILSGGSIPHENPEAFMYPGQDWETHDNIGAIRIK